MLNNNGEFFLKKTSGVNKSYRCVPVYFHRLLDIVGGLNHDYIIWQEVIDNGAKVCSLFIVRVRLH